ncbi:hypothetical protein D9613_009022 [Agrocybe pediades]|uniref:Uncharacterized protein n=1 Tax=Agrocybe pediades TaxID=84607 RepID=A0A8H4R6I6_9AGAR|nr:hypothetical protein D9613_009022 [Agrocybe pediades]
MHCTNVHDEILSQRNSTVSGSAEHINQLQPSDFSLYLAVPVSPQVPANFFLCYVGHVSPYLLHRGCCRTLFHSRPKRIEESDVLGARFHYLVKERLLALEIDDHTQYRIPTSYDGEIIMDTVLRNSSVCIDEPV